MAVRSRADESAMTLYVPPRVSNYIKTHPGANIFPRLRKLLNTLVLLISLQIWMQAGHYMCLISTAGR